MSRKDAFMAALISEALDRYLRDGDWQRLTTQLLSEKVSVVTAKEACAILKCSMSTFRRMNLPVITLADKTYRYRVSDIEAHLEKARS